MGELRGVYIKMERPNIRQRIIITTANLLLWLIVRLFKKDEDKMIAEIKDVIVTAHKSL